MAPVSTKERKKRRTATVLGAIIALAGLLIAVGSVGVLGNRVDGGVVDGVLVSTDVLWSSENLTDLDTVHQPLVTQKFCSANTELIAGDFASSAANGQGQGWTGIHSDIISGCNIDGSAQIKMTYDLTGAEFAALSPKAMGMGFTSDNAPFQEMNVSMGWTNPLSLATDDTIVLLGGPFKVQWNETSGEFYFPVNLPHIFLAGTVFPDHLMSLVWSTSGDHFPPAGTSWNIDMTLYGDNTTSMVTVNIVDQFGITTLLTGAFYITGILSTIAAVLIWPSMTIDRAGARMRGN